MDHQGAFNLEEELKNVPPEVQEEGHKIVHACQNTQGDDPCDTAFRIHKCYHDKNPEVRPPIYSRSDIRRTF
ncbi:unnamed protein product [Timema podura]|uniref:Uncharacterized protein n=1 Tax=Timema podura TaxID=61482 RepID=A0ABN7PNA2_TIMPD|nr:unnamed protein product [Timema podura]